MSFENDSLRVALDLLPKTTLKINNFPLVSKMLNNDESAILEYLALIFGNKFKFK